MAPAKLCTAGRGRSAGNSSTAGAPANCSAPVSELLFQHRPLQPLPLPNRVIRVLDRQLRQWRRCSGAERFVERRHFAHQNSHGPAVGDDVVQRAQQHVLFLIETQQPDPQQWRTPEVEGKIPLVRRQPADLRLLQRVAHPGKIPPANLKRDLVGDHLHELTVDHAKAGSQSLVTAHNFVNTFFQRLHVEAAAEPEANRNVVGGAIGLQLVKEPQSFL